MTELRRRSRWLTRRCVTMRQLGRLGRLGNQLFQIAATVAHARRCGIPYLFPHWEAAPYFGLRDCFRTKLPTRYDYVDEAITHTPIPVKKSLNLYGYFQSEKYFADCKPLIRSLLTPNIPVVKQPGVASIHVRREDFSS